MSEVGCNRLLLTGSVFEQGEGKVEGEHPPRARSPYGLSIGLTDEVSRFWRDHFDVQFAIFEIPNPYGTHEEQRFTAYLINSWLDNKSRVVNTPDYVRDNDHVSPMTKVCQQIAKNIVEGTSVERMNPGCFIKSQGSF